MMMNFQRDRRFSLIATHLSILIACCVSGCGESQQDLFMKHAQRDRGTSTKDEAKAPKATPDAKAKPPTHQVVSKQSPKVVDTSVSVSPAVPLDTPSTATDDPSDTQSLEEIVGITPISRRKPETELTVAQRRRRAFENLQKINDALLAYQDKNQRYPRTYHQNAGGVPTLSWRVELLPYLGYEELYKRFDFDRAWNMQPNKDLLQFIPDEYVSPERFDEKTNFVLPASPPFIFGENRSISQSMIDDGPENTIMLLEINDAHAVNWTEPKDFLPKSTMQMSPYVGKLRVDGTFALWANGFPVLLEKSLNDQQLFRAMSYEKSDGLRARDIHRAITVEEFEEDPDLDDSLSDQDLQPQVAEAERVPVGADLPTMIDDVTIAREPVPSAVQLGEAQEKLRRIYSDQLAKATKPDQKGKLAAELIDTAAGMDADPAGAFVLQRAALRLAIEAADGDTLIDAIDQRVARFEVDSFRENLKWIQAFGEETASRDASTVDGDGMLKRALPVIYAGIRENEYMFASSVARIANRFAGNNREDQISRLLTRLRTQLGSAKREYEQSVDDLHRFRINPDDVAAGAAFGSFLCFIKGDWKTGLPLVAEGKGGDLVEVARMDLRGASRTTDQIAIADAWWELSRRGSGAYRQGAEDRAVMWYSQALGRLPASLDRIHVENRLKEADETDGRSPIALCVQLADELGVDLSQSLTSIAVKGGRAARHNEDD
ncbi:hypothetical protein Enr13x_71570 [Stieleria neptunia]|uniref:DUF1559 domain-containing protein n=1 Tax=Stieleria neptunia TaxID=2527979 RepID=A0A518I2E0_9BACT|nr:DUF1559 domain-containing protein [Stieleria neptunia]QDV47248.1 hypothetical protein Enr13x_71570 [Stieleria neptunia]